MVRLNKPIKIFSLFYIQLLFIGETDWKLRLAVSVTQKLSKDSDLFNIDAGIHIEKPQNDIHSFIGIFSMVINNKDLYSKIEYVFILYWIIIVLFFYSNVVTKKSV